MRKRRRRLVIAAAVVAGALAVVVGGANALVLIDSGEEVATPEEAPRAPVAIVLGAKVEDDGRPSPMLADRVAVGVALYRLGKVRRLLLSGAGPEARRGPDEVAVMAVLAGRAGVPGAAVTTDYWGVDTYDTMIRARKRYGVKRALVVTQDFHLDRALYLARHAGIRATGVSADRRSYGSRGIQARIREVGARVKAVKDVVTGAEPLTMR